MNEFIEQFLIECRELVEQATGDLLALEEQPDAREPLDSAFRAFHTLKGAAGIVDFHAMGRALHAAEDVLARVRSGDRPITTVLISDSLTCLDQVVQWLDQIQAEGEPPAGAEAQADAIVARFTEAEPQVAGAPTDDALDWTQALLGQPGVGAACSAVRYRPHADCFFRGEDPLAVITALPGLLLVDLQPAQPWPALNALDPFACGLVLSALSAAPADRIMAALASYGEQVEVRAVVAAQPLAAPGPDLPAAARSLLEAQAQLVAAAQGEGREGKFAAAARVAANVFLSLGQPGAAAAITAAAAQPFADPALLVAAIEQASAAGVAAQDDDLLSEAPDADLAQPASDPGANAQASVEPRASALRVDVERIDALVRLAGELTVAKNALGHAAQLAQAQTDPQHLARVLKDQHAHLERLSEALQHAALGLRILPLRQVFQRFPRLVREMAGGLGKAVRLVTEGDDTEADKIIVEGLFEPLLHVLRNAVDHGVEAAATRAAAGKPAMATLWLRAWRDGAHVMVEVEDDGAGVDAAKVRQRAAAQGLASAESLAALSDSEAVDLIFTPGFSTAEQVTALSGRGVGMDAVRTAVERMGGRVSVSSAAGRGATVRLTLPFTVMITKVMTVSVGGQMFGVPFEAVAQTIRLGRQQIMPVGAGQAFVSRGRTIPLLDLAGLLGEARLDAGQQDTHVVVAATGGRFAGLAVDTLGEPMEVMLKPMEGLLAGTPGVAGATLLGDGRVLIVLDLAELME